MIVLVGKRVGMDLDPRQPSGPQLRLQPKLNSQLSWWQQLVLNLIPIGNNISPIETHGEFVFVGGVGWILRASQTKGSNGYITQAYCGHGTE